MGRSKQILNGKWQVITDWYNRGSADSYNDSSLNKNAFKEFRFDALTLNVPGDWNSQLPELKYYEGSVWYRKVVNFHKRGSKKAFLYFGGANYQADVYLNGKKIGGHEGGFTPFQFEVTSTIKEGNNDLIVRVNNQRRVDGIPAMAFDWWNYGGITRDVYLVQTTETYIDDYFIQLEKNSMNRIIGWVKLKGANRAGFVTVSIPELKTNRQFEVDENGQALIDIKGNFKLWSPERPKLYRVNIFSATDTIKDEIGFRSIQVKGTQIVLNGKPVFLKGISFHEEIPQRQGRAVDDADAKQLLTWAKELGCNFVRLAHYPQNEHTVRMAEAMGLMMWEEIPVWQGIAFNDNIILDKAKNMLSEMVERDKNRCGIIIWSLSNETEPSPDRNKVLTQMAAICRNLDSTRLVSSAFDHFNQEGNKITIDDELSKSLDVLAANKYMGWYAGWPSKPGEVLWESKFNKPLIMSEFGGEAVSGQHGPVDDKSVWGEEYQEQLYKDNIVMFNKIPFLAGVCPWIMADFRTPFRMNLKYQQGWNRKGLLSEKGEKKKAWYIIKDFYSTR
ncbi:glycoside hydrolase family 2 protein [Pedobacter frigidisoli]|nr:glycoside hydrolase family 2 TIM barrel-domain containing protein [Pedobacter frigidisoli]